MPDHISPIANQRRSRLAPFGCIVVIASDNPQTLYPFDSVPGAGNEAPLDPLLRRIVLASDETNHLLLLRYQGRKRARSIGRAKMPQIDKHEVRRDVGLRQITGDKVMLIRIVRRDVE